MTSKGNSMFKYFNAMFLLFFIFSGCSNIPPTEEIENDITIINTEIENAKATAQDYSGGLLALLIKIRIETLKSTKTMLEQKKNGYKRFIPLSYSIDGKTYLPPDNKNELLNSLNNDLEDLQKDLSKAEKESSQYSHGLLGVLSLTQVATIKNSISFLNQKKLLLKYDIPYYSIMPNTTESSEPGFEPTPGEDIEKF